MASAKRVEGQNCAKSYSVFIYTSLCANQPAGLHLAGRTQNSRIKLRRVVRQSKMAPKPEIAQHPERRDTSTMRSPRVDHDYAYKSVRSCLNRRFVIHCVDFLPLFYPVGPGDLHIHMPSLQG